jgi:hypothetical protein
MVKQLTRYFRGHDPNSVHLFIDGFSSNLLVERSDLVPKRMVRVQRERRREREACVCVCAACSMLRNERGRERAAHLPLTHAPSFSTLPTHTPIHTNTHTHMHHRS